MLNSALPRCLVRVLMVAAVAIGALGWGTWSADPTVRVVAVGDILLARGVARAIARHGHDYPFGSVMPLLRDADIAFGNLECPVSQDAATVPKPFSFRASPEDAAVLGQAGFDVLSLANNHTLDCGEAGLQDTLRFLQAHRIAACGAGPGPLAATPAVLKRHGLRIACVALCDVVQDGYFPASGGYSIARASHAAISTAVRNARRSADVVVLSVHWGREYAPRPTERQRALAHTASAAGADLILGHHPHVLQGLEWIRRPGRPATLVAYSLGNFVLDARRQGADRTMALRMTLTRHGVQTAEAIPLCIRNCAPYRPSPSIRRAILHRLRGLSAELGANVRDGFTANPQPAATSAPRSR